MKIEPCLLWTTDADGVLFRVDEWARGRGHASIFNPIEDLNYRPDITYDEFVRLVREQPGDDVVEKIVNAVNATLSEGALPLTRAVLERIGRELPLFPGVIETMIKAKNSVENIAGPRAKLHIAISSCGFAPVLRAAFKNAAVIHPGLIVDVTGQEFAFDNNGRALGVSRAFLSKDKAVKLREHVASYGVHPARVLVTYDGISDWDLIESNAIGTNIQVFEPGDSFAESTRNRTYGKRLRNLPSALSNPPVFADYSPTGIARKKILEWVETEAFGLRKQAGLLPSSNAAIFMDSHGVDRRLNPTG